MMDLDLWLALGVVLSTAATDAVYVMFNAAGRRGGAFRRLRGAACGICCRRLL
jgi:hypothetical protein